jgi:hypothetical protein
MPTLTQTRFDSMEVLLTWENGLDGNLGTTIVASSSASTSADVRVSPSPQHLLTEDLGTFWRSGSLVSETMVTLTFTLGEVTPVDIVELHRHNIRVPWRVSVYSQNPATHSPLYTSDWVDPIVRAEMDDYTFDDFDWNLGPSPRQLTERTSLARLDSFILLDRLYSTVAWVIIEFDVSEPPESQVDWLQVAYPFAGRKWQPTINMILGHTFEAVDRSEIVRTSGNSVQGRRKQNHRAFGFSIPYLAEYEVLRRLISDLAMAKGQLGRIFVWPKPQDRRLFYDSAFVGTIQTLPKAEQIYLEFVGAVGWRLEETE